MKQGQTLQEIIREISAQMALKRDFMVNTKSLQMTHIPRNGDMAHQRLQLDGVGEFRLQSTAHRQIGDRLGIPAKYYDRMQQDAPELLTENVNHWLTNNPEDRMVRTLGRTARAFLSNRYRRLDNYDLMGAIMPTLATIPQLTIESCAITDERLYLKAVTARIEGELSPGDVVNAGVVITNSEVGHGAFKVEPMIYRLICKNGLIAADHSMQKYHVGRTLTAGEAAAELFSDEALQADDVAFWLKARDVVAGSFSEQVFSKIVNRMREAKQQPITGTPHKAVAELTNRFGLTEFDTDNIFQHLLTGGDLSKLGMANAVTRHSQDVTGYDQATDMERLGGRIIELNATEWRTIATAA